MIEPANRFLASDAEPLKVATDELMIWSVTVREALKGAIDSLNAVYEPLKIATEALSEVSIPAPPAPVITHP